MVPAIAGSAPVGPGRPRSGTYKPGTGRPAQTDMVLYRAYTAFYSERHRKLMYITDVLVPSSSYRVTIRGLYNGTVNYLSNPLYPLFNENAQELPGDENQLASVLHDNFEQYKKENGFYNRSTDLDFLNNLENAADTIIAEKKNAAARSIQEYVELNKRDMLEASFLEHLQTTIRELENNVAPHEAFTRAVKTILANNKQVSVNSAKRVEEDESKYSDAMSLCLSLRLPPGPGRPRLARLARGGAGRGVQHGVD